MRRAVPFLAVLAAALPPAPAHAAVRPIGLACSFVSVANPFDGSRQVGEIDAGPLVLGDDADPTRFYTGRITCTIQVNAPRHSDPDAVVLGSVTTPAAVATAGVIEYTAGVDAIVYLCTRLDLTDGTTLYEDVDDPSGWSTYPDAPCDGPLEIE